MIHFRQGKKGDETSVLKLVEEVLSEYGLALNTEEADLDVMDLEAYYINNHGWFEVAEENGQIIGSVGIYKLDEQTCELRKMYLYPKYQGQGIGKALMDHALEGARELGYKVITLQTNSVLVKALPLYEKYGFRQDNGEVCSRCDISMRRRL
ncbi:MAG: GNAT family N-acetyltransferase [Candidatus Niameybacter stercoravium]|nr:GNAT family N-acetyltransferase [Candidatus Niameybacter stercoravium]